MNPDALVLSTQEGYDRWSEIYDDESNPLVIIEGPEVTKALGDVRGLEVLDVGCGTGRHSIAIALAGARVTGIDFSNGMLEKARTKQGALSVRFIDQDASGTLPFADRSFDRVISCLVVDHVRDLKTFFSELRRLCRPGGLVVVSVMHPAMMLKGVQARFTDPRTGQEVRPASAANQISDYVLAALHADLRILHLSEHKADDELVARAPRAAKYLGWPILFLMKLTPTPVPERDEEEPGRRDPLRGP